MKDELNSQRLITTIRESMYKRRLVANQWGDGDRESKCHYKWLLAWAKSGRKEVERLCGQHTFPPHPDGGHWAKEELMAMLLLVEHGII